MKVNSGLSAARRLSTDPSESACLASVCVSVKSEPKPSPAQNEYTALFTAPVITFLPRHGRAGATGQRPPSLACRPLTIQQTAELPHNNTHTNTHTLELHNDGGHCLLVFSDVGVLATP